MSGAGDTFQPTADGAVNAAATGVVWPLHKARGRCSLGILSAGRLSASVQQVAVECLKEGTRSCGWQGHSWGELRVHEIQSHCPGLPRLRASQAGNANAFSRKHPRTMGRRACLRQCLFFCYLFLLSDLCLPLTLAPVARNHPAYPGEDVCLASPLDSSQHLRAKQVLHSS